MKELKLDELNQLYEDSDSVDRDLYAEMRSNILLIAGEHYSKNVSKYFNRLRETNRVTENMKLRLTKNHIHKVHRVYTDAIVSKVPGVTALPNNEAEMQDQKDAQLNNLVWDNIKRKHKMKEKVRDWASEYIGVGEVATKIFWDPKKGYLKGYAQKVNEQGEPLFKDHAGQETTQAVMMDQMGQQMQHEMLADDEQPIFSGDFVFEPLFGFNLFRSPSAKSMEESPYIGLRKMVLQKELKALYKDDPDKVKFLEKSSETDYIVFDSSKAQYEKKENNVLVKEIYYRPCFIYPNGYFYIWTEFGVLESGELPYGIFPIKWKAFDKYPTTPRGRSIIKVARPFQAEINRAASQRATHQITLGDDKVLYQAGTKLAPGGLLPGVRGISYQGAPPAVIPGRTGEQFAGYVESEKADMFDAIMLGEFTEEEGQTTSDPYALLFRTLSQQAKYKQYFEKFEEFLVEVMEVVLELAKIYLPDEDLLQMVGRDEQVNILEFRKTTRLCYQIKVEPQTDSVDTMLGKQLSLSHMLQYVGKQLSPSDIGKVMRAMPFANNEEIFSEMTIDSDNVKNDMLAIERGEQPQLSPYAENGYYVKKLTHRMKQPDFKFLQPQIQKIYAMVLQQHEQEVARKEQAMIDAKNEYIPVGGAMITLSMRVPDDKGSTKQVRLPYQSLQWLISNLEKQGMSLDELENMNKGAVADMVGMMKNQQQESQSDMANNDVLQNQFMM